MTASRWAATTASRISWCSSRSWAASSRSPSRSPAAWSASWSSSARRLSTSGRWSGYSMASRSIRSRAASSAACRAIRSSTSRLEPDDDAHPPDDPGQGQSLPDEGRQDDAQGQVDEQRAIREVDRERERRRQGDDAAHSRPGDDEDGAARRHRVALPDLRADPARHVGRREDPDDPGQDGRRADRQPEPQELSRGRLRELVEDRRQLDADQQEREPVDEEDQDPPDSPPDEPGVGRQDPGRPPAGDDPGGDGREHAAQPERLGRQVGRERGEERGHDLERRVGDPLPGGRQDEADERPRSRSRRGRRRRTDTRPRRSRTRRRSSPPPPRTGRRSGRSRR